MNFKDRSLRPAFWALGALLVLTGELHATAPGLLTYQGRLKESGLPVTAARTVTISFCDALTAGTCTTSPSGAQSVSVVNGLFRTTFTVPSTIALESGAWYLNVNVNAQDFTPRELLSANPYSIYASSASTLLADPGASYVSISTPVSFGAQDASGYSLQLSSGINAPAGTVVAKHFVGDGSALTGIAGNNKVSRTGDSMVGSLTMVGTTIYLTGADGNIVSQASITASAFFGDGSGLTGVSGVEGNTFASSKTFVGDVLVSGGGVTASSATFVYGVSAATAAFTGGASASGGTYGFFSSGPTFDFYGNGDSFIGQHLGVGALGAGKASIQGTGTAYSLLVSTNGSGSTQNLVVADNGRVGISTGVPGADLDVEGVAQFGTGGVKSTFNSAGGLFLASGSSLTLSGASGWIAVQSSVTASAFFGDGSGLTGVNAGSAVQKSGDVMTGELRVVASSVVLDGGALTVANGGILSTGTADAMTVPSAAGTRFLWIPSSGAVRGGVVTGTQWDPANIGAHSAAFGRDNKASGEESAIGGGAANTANFQYATVGGGFANLAQGLYATVAGGQGSSAVQNGSVGGGASNAVTASFGTVPGGANNIAGGQYSFAAGHFATASAQGSFVWNDSQSPTLTSAINDQMLLRTSGGYEHLTSSVTFMDGAGSTQLFYLSGSSAVFNVPLYDQSGNPLVGAGGGSGWTRSAPVVSLGVASDNVVIQSTLTILGTALSVGATGLVVVGDNVGLGTPNPAAKLHVSSGTILLDGFAVSLPLNPMLTIHRGGAGSGGAVQFGGDSNTGLLGTDNNGVTVLGSLTGPLAFNTSAVSDGFTLTNERVRIDATGQVGIGTVVPAALLDVNGSAQFGNGPSKSTFSASGGLSLASNAGISLTGVTGTIVTASSITAARYFGDGSGLSNISGTDSTKVAKAGDTMTGALVVGSSVSVTGGALSGVGAPLLLSDGVILASGTSDGFTYPAIGAGTRFVWLPSSAAIRAGQVSGTQWDPVNIGVGSVAFGQDSQATAGGATVGGGVSNRALSTYATVSGGGNNVANGTYATVPGGQSNAASGLASFAAGTQAGALANGSFVWSDSVSGPLNNNIADSFLARAMGGFDLRSSSFVFLNAVSTMMYIDNTSRVGIGFSTPTVALDVKAVAGDQAVAVFRDSSGVAVASVTAGGLVASIQQWSFTLYDPQGIEAVDDIPSIISNRLGDAVTINEVWCESDDGTATINLRQDGSVTNILTTDLNCGTTGTPGTVFNATEKEIPILGKIDYFTQTVAAGAAHRINVVVKYIMH